MHLPFLHSRALWSLASAALLAGSAVVLDAAVALPIDSAFPAPGASDVCPDTPLRLTFASAPQLGSGGRIHIVDAATGKDADIIDLGAPFATKSIGGEPNYRYLPVIIDGRQATIYPRNGSLQYNHTYLVTADAGILKLDGAPSATIDAATGWKFSTKAAGPAAGTTGLIVAADGSGDFCTVQGALDFIPEGNTAPTTVHVRRGTYTEIVFFTNKHAVTLIGEDRRQTVIAYATNDRFNPTNGNPFGDAKPDPSAARAGGRGHIYHRGVFLAHRVNDLVLANLTIRNTTPQGGSQAEAIILNGTTGAHAILKDVDLYSYQDTLQINGQAYLSGCYIEGDIDFMWGTGPCFFENCTCRSLRSAAYYTQIRNPGSNHGYVYVGCRFDGIQGVMGNYLSRIGTSRFPNSEVVLIDCTLTTAVSPLGWQFQGGGEGNEGDPADVHFWEFNSRDPARKPVDMTFRLRGTRRLVEPADSGIIANYRNPTWVLGGEWNPRSAPVFASKPATASGSPVGTPPSITLQPAGQIALLGTGASFAVVTGSTGGATVGYQWAKNGHPLPGATSATLRVPHVGWSDAAVYSVTVSTASGRVTSEPARLTPVVPQTTYAPNLPIIPDAVRDVTDFGAKGDGATDNTAFLQKAIDTTATAGGGTVVVPAAAKPYLSGPLTLASKVNLEIAVGATLQALPYSTNRKPGFYPLEGKAYANFISANGAHDVALSGLGTINGNGDAWWTAFKANKAMPHRPFLVRFNKCERVLVSGLTFTRSPMFHVAISADHLTVCGVTVDTPDAPNTDGIDPAGSHQLFQNCRVSCGDDNIVMKPGGVFCSDITIADCAFGEGHGMSVGGQSNQGLDGMVVKNCSFTGTTSGLRLKADPTQGGEVKNLSYANLTMQDVQYPIVFYSYYNKVGNPGSVSGSNQTTPKKAADWNAAPPNPLTTSTMPSWKNIAVSNLLASGSRGYSIIWGLPAAGYLIDNVRLTNVRITGSPGFEIYNAGNVQFAGDSSVGTLITGNALVVTRQPQSQTISPGGTATFAVQMAPLGTTSPATAAYQWTFNGERLSDGEQKDGAKVSGSGTATLTVADVARSTGGKYAVTVSAALEGYDSSGRRVVPAAITAAATTSPAVLTVSSDR